MSAARDEELLTPRAPHRRLRVAALVLAGIAVAVLITVRLTAGGSPSRDSLPPPSLPDTLVPSPVSDPFCSPVSPCTSEQTVRAAVASALDEDVGAVLVSSQTYVSSGIELTADSLQYRRLDARSGTARFVVVISSVRSVLPAVPAGSRSGYRVATSVAAVGRYTVEVVAIGVQVPSGQVLSRLAHDPRLLAVG
ncbi:MAG: hypothetical protein EPN43_02815, partial [Jatrophihabitans sp.]